MTSTEMGPRECPERAARRVPRWRSVAFCALLSGCACSTGPAPADSGVDSGRDAPTLADAPAPLDATENDTAESDASGLPDSFVEDDAGSDDAASDDAGVTVDGGPDCTAVVRCLDADRCCPVGCFTDADDDCSDPRPTFSGQTTLTYPGIWSARAMARTDTGYVVVGSVNISGTTLGLDAMVARFDASLALRRVTLFGSDLADAFEDVTLLPDGDIVAVGRTDGLLASGSRTGAYVARIAPDDTLVWSRREAFTSDVTSGSGAVSVTSSPSGELVVAATSFRSASGQDAYVLELDAAGTAVRRLRFDASVVDQAQHVAVAADGTRVFTMLSSVGATAVTIAIDGSTGTTRWARSIAPITTFSSSRVEESAPPGTTFLWLTVDATLGAPTIRLRRIDVASGAELAVTALGRLGLMADTSAGPSLAGSEYTGSRYVPAVLGLDATLTAPRFAQLFDGGGSTGPSCGATAMTPEPTGGMTVLTSCGGDWGVTRVSAIGRVGGCGVLTTPALSFAAAPSDLQATAIDGVEVRLDVVASVGDGARPLTAPASSSVCMEP